MGGLFIGVVFAVECFMRLSLLFLVSAFCACSLPNTFSEIGLDAGPNSDVGSGSDVDQNADVVLLNDVEKAPDVEQMPDVERTPDVEIFEDAGSGEDVTPLPDVIVPEAPLLILQASGPGGLITGRVPAMVKLEKSILSTANDVHFKDASGAILTYEIDSENSDFVSYWVGLEDPEEVQRIFVWPGARSTGPVFENYDLVEHFQELPSSLSPEEPSIVDTDSGSGMELADGEYAILGENIMVGQLASSITAWIRLQSYSFPAERGTVLGISVGTEDGSPTGRSRFEINHDPSSNVSLLTRAADNEFFSDTFTFPNADLTQMTILSAQRNYRMQTAQVRIGGTVGNSPTRSTTTQTSNSPASRVVVGANEDLTSGLAFDGVIDEIRVMSGQLSNRRTLYEGNAMSPNFFQIVTE